MSPRKFLIEDIGLLGKLVRFIILRSCKQISLSPSTKHKGRVLSTYKLRVGGKASISSVVTYLHTYIRSFVFTRQFSNRVVCVAHEKEGVWQTGKSSGMIVLAPSPTRQHSTAQRSAAQHIAAQRNTASPLDTSPPSGRESPVSPRHHSATCVKARDGDTCVPDPAPGR